MVKATRTKFITLMAAGVWMLTLDSAIFAAAGRIAGQVTNGTTGRPVANQSLQLLMPRGGMQQVATTATDASGRFELAGSDLSADSFYLLQANYQNVDYNAPVKFDDRGQASVDITVYDTTHTTPPLRIQSARIVVNAQGDKAHLQELFAIRNSTEPPRTYVSPNGTFFFHLAKATAEPTAAVAGLMNMPLPQAVTPGKGPGDYSIQYPLKPGLTVMMVAYDADYSSNSLSWAGSVVYPIDSAELLVSPSNLSVDSALFKAAGVDSDTGSQRYVAENLPAQAQLAASISGEATASQAANTQAASQNDEEVKSLPNSMTRMGGLVLASFLMVLLWGLGVRMAKEWPRWKALRNATQIQKALETEVEKLFNSIADLDELFAAGKIAEKPYWKERLELKARLVTNLKKAPPALLESYAIRHTPR